MEPSGSKTRWSNSKREREKERERERRREREREKEGERENMMAYTGSLNNLPILIRYCDTAEQKTRLKMNQT